MGFFSKLVGGEIAAPIEAIGNIIDTVHTSDDEKLTKQEIMLRLAQNPSKWQTEITKIEAQHRSPFVAGWRPFIGWVAGASLVCYYIPQYVIGPILWTRLSFAAIAKGTRDPAAVSGVRRRAHGARRRHLGPRLATLGREVQRRCQVNLNGGLSKLLGGGASLVVFLGGVWLIGFPALVGSIQEAMAEDLQTMVQEEVALLKSGFEVIIQQNVLRLRKDIAQLERLRAADVVAWTAQQANDL